MDPTEREKIRTEITEQLTSGGPPAIYITDIINDYINYIELKNILVDDLKRRGMFYTEYAGTPSERVKENSSMRTLINVNKIMLQILKYLRISAPVQHDPIYDDVEL